MTVSSPLAKIAEATGGTFTSNTNNISLGFDRARTSLGCRYALGFYPKDPALDRGRDVRVSVRGHGLQVAYAHRFGFRSPEKKREALLQAAFSSPGRFRNGIVRAHVFPLQPASRDRWSTVIAIRFPVQAEGGGEVSRDFGAVIYRGSSVVHRFDRRITVRGKGGAGPRPMRQVSFLEPVELKPGEYDLRVVLSDPRGESMSSWSESVEVPDLPGEETYLVGPVLGRQAGRDVVVRGSGQKATGEGPEASNRALDKEDRTADGRDTPSARFSVLAPERAVAAQHPVADN